MPGAGFVPPPSLPDAFARRLDSELDRRDAGLPAPDATATRLQELAARSDVDTGEVAGLVQADSALSERVLRAAGSRFYGGGEPGESVRGAVRSLGARAVGELAVALAARERLFAPLMATSPIVRRMWSRAALAGVYARRIGLMRGGGSRASMLVGLLADVGAPAGYGMLMRVAAEDGMDLDENTLPALIEALRVPIGLLVAERWRLPAPVFAAIEHHRDHAGAREERAAAMTARLATRLAERSLALGAPGGGGDDGFDAARDLGLAPADLEALIAGADEARACAGVLA